MRTQHLESGGGCRQEELAGAFFFWFLYGIRLKGKPYLAGVFMRDDIIAY